MLLLLSLLSFFYKFQSHYQCWESVWLSDCSFFLFYHQEKAVFSFLFERRSTKGNQQSVRRICLSTNSTFVRQSIGQTSSKHCFHVPTGFPTHSENSEWNFFLSSTMYIAHLLLNCTVIIKTSSRLFLKQAPILSFTHRNKKKNLS